MRLKNRSPLLKVSTIFRSVCLLLTVASILAGYVWSYQQEIINSIDKKLYKQYFEQHQMHLAHVNELFKAKKYAATAVQAEYYLSTMESIRKKNKIYRIKRELLSRLIQSKICLGMPHTIDALPYAEFWTKSDERDIDALRAYIHVLENVKGKDKDLQDALELFHYRFPGKSISPGHGLK